MQSKYVSIACGVMAALVFVPACSSLRSHEPRYEGKRLSVWATELDTPSREEKSLSQMSAREATWTNVVQTTGTNGIPFYVQWLGDTNDQSHKYRAERAIEILGPAAEPAIPALASLLRNDQASIVVANCLLATGPAAIPALTEAVETLTNRGRMAAITILGEFGPAATPAVLVLTQIIKSDSPLVWPAMQTLVEIETNPAVVLPLLALHVADTNCAVGAAYALGRLGNAGVPMLLTMLTNETKIIRYSAAGALHPVFQEYLNGKSGPSAPGFQFRRMCCAFNLKILGEANRASMQGDFVAAAEISARYTNSPDANIREAANNALKVLRPLAETNVPQSKLDLQNGFMPRPRLPGEE